MDALTHDLWALQRQEEADEAFECWCEWNNEDPEDPTARRRWRFEIQQADDMARAELADDREW